MFGVVAVVGRRPYPELQIDDNFPPAPFVPRFHNHIYQMLHYTSSYARATGTRTLHTNHNTWVAGPSVAVLLQAHRVELLVLRVAGHVEGVPWL